MSGNTLSKLRDAYAKQKPQREQTVLQSLSGQGGPMTDALIVQQMRQRALRDQLMRTDPAKFRSFVQRGFDSFDAAQPVSGDAAQFMNADNPAVQNPDYVVSATPSAVIDPMAQLRNDVLFASYNSPRGKTRHAAKAAEDEALQRKVDKIKNGLVPADYGDGDFSTNRKVIDALFWLTGQGGGMR